jgi:hypothetical protein
MTLNQHGLPVYGSSHRPRRSEKAALFESWLNGQNYEARRMCSEARWMREQIALRQAQLRAEQDQRRQQAATPPNQLRKE